jgi:hypothetical protein
VAPDSDATPPEPQGHGSRPPADTEVDSPIEDGETFGGVPGEDETEAEGAPHTALPPKLEAWRKRSATGAVLTGFALGLQQAFEKEREQPAIVMQTSGDPPKDLPVEADVQHGRPRHSVVSIRPWLLGRKAKGSGVERSDDDARDRDREATAGQAGAGQPEDH